MLFVAEPFWPISYFLINSFLNAAFLIRGTKKILLVVNIYIENLFSGSNRLLPVSAERRQQVAAAIELIRKDFQIWIPVTALAKMVGLSEWQLERAFKSLYNKTAIQYARGLRLQYAHDKLAKSDAPLRVVCEMVGYPDSSNF